MATFNALHAHLWQISAPRLTHIVLGSFHLERLLAPEVKAAWVTEQKTAPAAIYLPSVIAPALIFTAVFFWETVASEKYGNYLREKSPRSRIWADEEGKKQKWPTNPGKHILLSPQKKSLFQRQISLTICMSTDRRSFTHEWSRCNMKHLRGSLAEDLRRGKEVKN